MAPWAVSDTSTRAGGRPGAHATWFRSAARYRAVQNRARSSIGRTPVSQAGEMGSIPIRAIEQLETTYVLIYFDADELGLKPLSYGSSVRFDSEVCNFFRGSLVAYHVSTH